MFTSHPFSTPSEDSQLRCTRIYLKGAKESLKTDISSIHDTLLGAHERTIVITINGDFPLPIHDPAGTIIDLDDKFLCKNALSLIYTIDF